MNKHDIYKSLSTLIKNDTDNKKILLYRGDAELDLLKQWLDKDKASTINNKEVFLKNLIESCNKCIGVDEKKFGIGSGKNRMMVILNAPRLIKRVEKQVLKKDSIELLKKIIMSIGIDFTECYITNLFKCEISDPRIEPSQAVLNCESIMRKEIELMNPLIVIVFGDIIPLQNIIKESSNISWFNIEHPITLVKNPELKRPAWNTMKMVMEKMKEIS